jgi:hypothetical protein
MAKGKNFHTLMDRMHNEARKAYLAGDTKYDHLQTMLNIEANFQRAEKQTGSKMLSFYREILVKQREQAIQRSCSDVVPYMP